MLISVITLICQSPRKRHRQSPCSAVLFNFICRYYRCISHARYLTPIAVMSQRLQSDLKYLVKQQMPFQNKTFDQ